MAEQVDLELTGLPIEMDFQMDMDGESVTDQLGSLNLIMNTFQALDWVQFPVDPEGQYGTINLLGYTDKFLGKDSGAAVISDTPQLFQFYYYEDDGTYEVQVLGEEKYLTNEKGTVLFMSKTGNESKQRWKFRKTVAVLTQEQPKVMN